MISVLTAAVVLQTPAMSGGELFSKMLGKYHTANSLKGTIAFVQSASGAKVQILTTLQHQKPNLFYIEQVRQPKSADVDSNQFMAVSDGKRFAYSVPKNFLPMTDATSGKHNRLFEPAPASIDEGLNVFCTFLLDRSLAVAIALYNPYEIQRVTTRFTNLKIVSDNAEYEGAPAYKVSADYTVFYAKPEKNQPAVKVPATIIIDKEMNLRYIAWQEVVGAEVQGQRVTATVNNEWLIKLQVNPTEIEKNLFTVR